MKKIIIVIISAILLVSPANALSGADFELSLDLRGGSATSFGTDFDATFCIGSVPFIGTGSEFDITLFTGAICDVTSPTTSVVLSPKPAHSLSNLSFIVNCFDTNSKCSTTVVITPVGVCSIDHFIENMCEIEQNIMCDDNNYAYSVTSYDLIGNTEIKLGTFEVKKKDGCNCISSDECYGGVCVGMSYCANLIPPEIDFDFTGSGDSFEIPLGKTKILLIKLKNPLDIPDSIELSIYGNPIEIKYWSYFEGQKYESRTKNIVHLEPLSEISVPLNVLGGKAGEYMLRVEAKSLTNSQKASKDLQVAIFYTDKDGHSTNTPGLGVVGLIVLILLAALIIARQ